MRLITLGSDSKGCGYILTNDTEALIIECGRPLKEALPHIDYNLSIVKAALVSHRHGDHSKFIRQYCDAGINILAGGETLEHVDMLNDYRIRMIRHKTKLKAGGFFIKFVEVQHDAECYGFMIRHKDFGRLLFLTDTYLVPYRLDGFEYICVDCNYSKEILDRNVEDGRVPNYLRRRLKYSHLDIETVVRILGKSDLSAARKIVLLHLSDKNSDELEFMSAVVQETGKPTYVAAKNLTIEL